MPTYKFIYFNVRGRGEATRYIFVDNNIPFEEQLIPGKEWAKLKTTMAFGQAPKLVVDGGFELVQSNAIIRFLAREHGLYGSNNNEAAMIDMINDGQEDLRSKYSTMIYKNFENGKDDYLKELPDSLKNFEALLSKNNGGEGFFVGDKISFVDYTMYDLLDSHVALCSTSLDAFPKLKAFHGRMAARAPIAAYRQTDAFKARVINGNKKGQ